MIELTIHIAGVEVFLDLDGETGEFIDVYTWSDTVLNRLNGTPYKTYECSNSIFKGYTKSTFNHIVNNPEFKWEITYIHPEDGEELSPEVLEALSNFNVKVY